ncbi:hypothetical protein [Methylopila turkensis]|uniref:Serine/threonine protein kinase n=1 Tax=Methylopila turkensis TaxID=1437816 RepID=A0A9W6JLI0_9HYPH|nr:hypothetical protein [Methylopila turkensis]GLK79382.1 hypothetical protein GCM10008174_11230 [Methylopila turkensis]
MKTFVRATATALFAASVIAAPAAMAQTSPSATSTEGATFQKDRAEADAVRDGQTAAPMGKSTVRSPADNATSTGGERALKDRAESDATRKNETTAPQGAGATPKDGKPLGPTNNRS